MSIYNKISKKIVNKLDQLFLDNFTVNRGKGKRKYVWKTKYFREISQIYIPRMIFTGFIVFMCWKINDKVRSLRKNHLTPYTSISNRQEKVEEDNKV